MGKQRTFTKTLYLDKPFSRSSEDIGQWAGTTVKAFRVIETNNDSFQLDIVADPIDGSIQGIPLGEVRVHNYTTLADNAVFENKISQPTVWVKVLISVEDPLIYTGEKKTGGSSVLVVGGANFAHDVASVDNVGVMVLTADDNRASSIVYNYESETVYLGSQAKVQHANYQTNGCIKLRPGESFTWDLPVALYGRTEGSTFNLTTLTKKAA